MSAAPPTSPSPGDITSGGQFFLLVFRTFVGYGVLFVCLLLLLRRTAWDLSVVDIVYWTTLLLLLGLHRAALRTRGALASWRRLVVQHFVFGGLAWLAGHSVHLIQ